MSNVYHFKAESSQSSFGPLPKLGTYNIAWTASIAFGLTKESTLLPRLPGLCVTVRATRQISLFQGGCDDNQRVSDAPLPMQLRISR
jgi:hypothetical protein